MPVINGTRLWSNNGHTPDEIARISSHQGPVHPTVVPMSTSAAEFLEEGQVLLHLRIAPSRDLRDQLVGDLFPVREPNSSL